MSIDRTGQTVTIASSRGPRTTFDADGRTHREQIRNGVTIDTRAEMVGDTLTVSTSGGNRYSDYTVTFEPINGGNDLLVTRRLDDETLARPITMQSYYQRTTDTPQWDVYRSAPGDRGPGPGYAPSGARAIIPDGTRLVATLDTPLSMRSSSEGAPFEMTVRSPSQYAGARLDGVVSRVNTRNGSNGDMQFNFRDINYNGRSSAFDGSLDSVRLSNGNVLRVNGSTPDEDRTNDAIQKGAIGAAVGAVIGAIAGGGKGAAIGAAVGGVGGVVISQGQESADIPRGSEVTVTSYLR
jgi:hypothetical protein